MRLALFAVAVAALGGGCAAHAPRLRLISSETGQASWSFVVQDSARAAQLLIDGRPRVDACRRAGVMLRCELRGLFPGGHTLELRLAGGLLRRTAFTGPDWSPRPVLVRGRDLATVAAAAHAGADAVLIPWAMEPIAIDELVEGAHKGGIRVVIEAPTPPLEPARLGERLERHGLDGVVGASLDADARRRFPSAVSLAIDVRATQALAAHLAGESLPLAALVGDGLVEARGPLALGLSLLAGRAAITDGASFTLLGVRRRHKALREGAAAVLADDGRRRAVRLQAGGDAVTLVTNASPEPYTPAVELPPSPIDLLGGPILDGRPVVPPGDIAAILASP
jgi:hypothetical protein